MDDAIFLATGYAARAVSDELVIFQLRFVPSALAGAAPPGAESLPVSLDEQALPGPEQSLTLALTPLQSRELGRHLQQAAKRAKRGRG